MRYYIENDKYNNDNNMDDSEKHNMAFKKKAKPK